ncbi:3'-5' exonuclease domain-containing protein 2 [Fabibacter sp. E12]|nr:3'-5' exonuclease domain-containing protein 2 [Roseivirga sp. E12]
MFPLSITKDEVMDRPLKSYEGKVVIAADVKSTEKAISEINQFDVVGFDTEAKPTFQKGQIRNISLIQVATDEKVYLLRTHHIGVIDSLHHFLQNEKIKKVGIGLLDDFNLLNRLRAFEPNGFVDLNDTFQELGAENIGARNLAAMVLDIRISKSAQTSNWEAEQLAQKQIKYAATDAWICLEIQKKLSFWGYV